MSANVGLNENAQAADRALADIDARIDWLTLLTPTNLDAASIGFRDSGFRTMPDLEYPDIPSDFENFRSELFSLKMRNLGNSDIEALLIEKQRELDRQIELVRLRGRTGFTMASIDLFGDVNGRLLAAAEKVLATVPTRDKPVERSITAESFMKSAQKEMDGYKKTDPRFQYTVIEETTPGTHIFTSSGNLHVAYDYRCAKTRVDPLIQHEVGTHSVTRFNGSCQPLTVLECGLADYDDLQEGIAVLAEYLAGDMPPSRLRVLAARVIAARMAIDDEPVSRIYSAMRDGYSLDASTSFDTTVRALRGGGMTKDALYLNGLIDLLAYLKNGGDVSLLFIGKFALKQRAVLSRLLSAGLLKPPAIIPKNFTSANGKRRLTEVRKLEVEQFYIEKAAA